MGKPRQGSCKLHWPDSCSPEHGTHHMLVSALGTFPKYQLPLKANQQWRAPPLLSPKGPDQKNSWTKLKADATGGSPKSTHETRHRSIWVLIHGLGKPFPLSQPISSPTQRDVVESRAVIRHYNARIKTVWVQPHEADRAEILMIFNMRNWGLGSTAVKKQEVCSLGS